MTFNKLFTFTVAGWLVFQTSFAFAVAPTPTPAAKHAELSPELKRNALRLLSSIASQTGQLQLAENRVRARTIIGDLMWRHDEAAARAVYLNAFTELQNLFRQIDGVRSEDANSENGKHYAGRFRLNELRLEYVLTLAAHDPAAAFDGLRELKTKKIKDWDPLAERFPLLKFETAAAIAVSDPNLAHIIYKDELAVDGITLPLVESLNDLHRKNSELTAKIFKEIFAVIKTAKIGEFSPAGHAAKSVVRKSKQTEIYFWQVTVFLNAAFKLNRQAERDKKTLPPLAEGEIKELAGLLARAFLNATNPPKNTINQAMTAITRHAPGEVRRIRQKVGTEGVRAYRTVMESDAYYLMLEEKGADDLAAEANRTADLDTRDLLYSEAARKALAEKQAEKAQTIAERIERRERYAMLFLEIEFAVPLAAARGGNQAAVRQMLPRLKTKEEQMAVLLELASALAAKGDKEAAKKLLDETIDMLFTTRPDSKPDETSHESSLELPGKFAAVSLVIAPDEAFTNIERIIDSVNAEIKRDASSGNSSLEDKEMFFDSMQRQALRRLPNSIELLKNLARADFERTVKLMDRFERREIRLLARLRLAEALLDARAAEKEKDMHEQLMSEDSEH